MIKVIIVDDEMLAGIGIQSLIDGKEDVMVVNVFSGPEEAIPFLRKTPVDIVITDIEMADMNGLDFIEVIRSANLASGVIILSCHDDFSYAQEAISRGTDAYLLKHKISGPILLSEIRKVYAKHGKNRTEEVSRDVDDSVMSEMTGEEIFRVGVFRTYCVDMSGDIKSPSIDANMFYHLLDGLVRRYNMGTMFLPYDKDPFILFKVDRNQTESERNRHISENISTLIRSARHYVSGRLLFGISSEMHDLKEMRNRYQEAITAVQRYYYEPDVQIFFYHDGGEPFVVNDFSYNSFLSDQSMEIFSAELDLYLKKAAFCRVEPVKMKGQLMQALSRFLDRALDYNLQGRSPDEKQNLDSRIFSIVTNTGNVTELREQLIKMVAECREQAVRAIERDEISEALAYIEEHLDEKINLVDLAEKCCMSVPSFTKKFKERTGETLVQYLNEQRIERVKILLRNRHLSLEQIAEQTGFSNSNYLIRVFKKTTGKTVSEYRR
ncbi:MULTISPECIES: AraC family transcriptional regulator [unclassified Bilifractor]|uniref:response regulator n=1 Tax=unclassified Bilifractor TaxID=2815795 RepID=UPI003F8F83DD